MARLKVWVVMGNDYPEAVFYTENAAEAFCRKKKREWTGNGPRIFWRAYEFVVKRRG